MSEAISCVGEVVSRHRFQLKFAATLRVLDELSNSTNRDVGPQFTPARTQKVFEQLVLSGATIDDLSGTFGLTRDEVLAALIRIAIS